MRLSTLRGVDASSRWHWELGVSLALVLLVLASCAARAKKPPEKGSAEEVRYQDRVRGYTFLLPSYHWKMEKPSGFDLEFSHHRKVAQILVDTRWRLVPVPVTATRVERYLRSVGLRDPQVENLRTEYLCGRAAERAEGEAEARASWREKMVVRRRFVAYFVENGRRLHCLYYVARAEDLESTLSDFERLAHSFEPHAKPTENPPLGEAKSTLP